MKGAWEGRHDANHEKTKDSRAAANAQWFEDNCDRQKYASRGQACPQAIEVVWKRETGPITPMVSTFPRSTFARSSAASPSPGNVLEFERSMPDSFRHEFAWDDAEAERAKRWGAFAGELTTEIHEVLGHGSGRMADHITVTPQDLLKEQYSALEETRADLVALYFVADPHLSTLGLVPTDEQQAVVQTEYEAYARNALVQLRRVRVGAQLEEDHMRNRQAIVTGCSPQQIDRVLRRTTRPSSWSSIPTRFATACRSCWPKCSGSSRKATTRRRRNYSRPTGSTSIPKCATRSSPASIT